jgi:prepilin peptidase CpaA
MSGSSPPLAALAPPRPTSLPLRTRAAWGSRESWALAASLAVACALGASAVFGALPAAWATAAFLLPAVFFDVRELRIPNWLTAPALLATLAAATALGGWAGLGSAAGAAACLLALGFGPFAWGWLGAGDVKALMVLAALWGLDAFFPALWWMLVIGGVAALVLLTLRGGLGDLLRRWGRSAWLSLASRRIHYVPAAADATARQGLPFAVAMGLGCAAAAVWGIPW